MPSGTTDDSFVGGTKENDTTVGITAGSIPNKDDLLRAYAATDSVIVGGTPTTFLYLSWVRLVSNGDAHIDFELNQDGSTNWTPSGSPPMVTIKPSRRPMPSLIASCDPVLVRASFKRSA